MNSAQKEAWEGLGVMPAKSQDIPLGYRIVGKGLEIAARASANVMFGAAYTTVAFGATAGDGSAALGAGVGALVGRNMGRLKQIFNNENEDGLLASQALKLRWMNHGALVGGFVSHFHAPGVLPGLVKQALSLAS